MADRRRELSKGLGDRQWAVLRQLHIKGGWWPGCGWPALPGDSPSRGYGVLHSLRDRGLVESTLGNYRLTADGRTVLGG